uniref:E3 ubiquitin-protein ligase DZIP3-like n=1 Tax=Callorhinchus milii TaxID=7868 RepID=A0A4W3KJ05_CALMI
MDENRKKSELSGNSSAETSNGTRGKQGSRSRNEASRPRRATLPVEVPKKCYLLRELTAKRMAIEKGMLDVDQLVLKLITSGNLDFITLNEITKYPVKEDRTRILLDHFSKINDNGILRQFVSFMRDPLILNSEALQWAEYMQGCSDSCCMFFIKRYSNVFKYALEEQGIESFAEYFEESGVLNSSEIEELCKYSFKEAAEQFMHILFTKTTILTVANMWFVLVEFRHEIPYLGPYIDSFLDAFDEQTGFFSPRFDPLLPVEPLLVGKCYVNLYRLLHIIHVEGTEAVRSIFDRHITSAELEEEVRKNKVLIKNRLEGKDFSSFSKIWLNIIYSTEKFKTVHFTLPLFQFLAVFMKKFPRPKKGWTGRLAKSDTSSGAYLRRICEMRDSLLKDIFFTDVFYSKFDKLWNEITQILVQLGVSDKRLQELKTQPMSAVFMDRKYMEKYFNKPLSQLLEELIVRHHKGISSVCACSLEENLPSEQPKKLEAKVADITKAKVADIKEQNTKAKVADIKEQNTKAKVADIKEQNTKAKVADIKEQNTKAKVADIKEQNTKAKKEQKEKDTSEDESEPLTTAENTKSKKRRKRARGKKGKKTEAAAPTLTKEAETLGELKCLSLQSSEVPLEQQVMTQEFRATETGKDLTLEQDSLTNTSHLENDQPVSAASQAVSVSPTEPEYCANYEDGNEEPEIETETSHTEGKTTDAAAPTLTKEVETLGELKCLSPQSSEVPLEQQVMTQKSPATETGKDLKSEQDSLSNTSHLETDQSVPVASQAVSTSPTEPEYCENRHEKPEIEVETSHTKILDRLIDACVNTDPVDFKESFKRLEVERNALMQNIENLNDRCKQTENKSHLEIKAWKQRIREKERQCQSLQQEFVSLNQQLKEEFRRMAQEQEDHQTQLLKVKDQICGKKSELERCIKSNIDKDKEIMKVKRELQQERERWLREKLQLEEELANIQQTELETLRKAINQEVFLLEMHRDFFVCNLESALVETEQQLTNLKDHIKGQTVVPPLIQGALNKWEGVATDLRNKIDYTTKEFNNHIYMIKNGAKLQSLPPLNNPEQPYPLSLHVMKSGNQANVLHSLGSQPSLQAYTGSPIPVMPSSLRGYNNRLELNSFIDQVQTGQELWTGFGKQKSSETRVQLQSTEEDPCVICHEELVPSEDCYMLECKHVFHRKCIDHWLKEQSTCPICRILVLKPEDYPQLSKN